MRRKQLTPDDECRVLHEAYQFLFRKYNLGEVLEVTNKDAFGNDVQAPPSPGTYVNMVEKNRSIKLALNIIIW